MAAGSCGGDNRGAHGQLVGGQAGFFVGLADRGLLGGLMAVAGAAGQPPGATLMTPRGPVLEQYRRRTVRARRAQQ